mmetsp:Transcript_81248/g.146641  ORF Transcript_81248/g.146641 Transcript_81248/m.146641 type:complete len:254 (-) Transcript_81248:426-1187(-)
MQRRAMPSPCKFSSLLMSCRIQRAMVAVSPQSFVARLAIEPPPTMLPMEEERHPVHAGNARIVVATVRRMAMAACGLRAIQRLASLTTLLASWLSPRLVGSSFTKHGRSSSAPKRPGRTTPPTSSEPGAPLKPGASSCIETTRSCWSPACHHLLFLAFLLPGPLPGLSESTNSSSSSSALCSGSCSCIGASSASSAEGWLAGSTAGPGIPGSLDTGRDEVVKGPGRCGGPGTVPGSGKEASSCGLLNSSVVCA